MGYTLQQFHQLHDTPEHLRHLTAQLYWGPKAICAYTTTPDKDGFYWSIYYKFSGPGARQGKATDGTYVNRLTSKRRAMSAVNRRSYDLSRGKKATASVKKKRPVQQGANLGFCMKEKKHVVMIGLEEIEAKNGRKMIRGKCPDCSTSIQKYGRLLHCPECGNVGEARVNDYICRSCREDAPN